MSPPAPEPDAEEPAAQVTAVVEGLDLEKLVGMWPAVVEQVKESGSGLLSQILSAAKPVAVNLQEAVVEVGFPASAAFNKRKAEGTDARDRLEEAVKAIVGERLRPVFVLLESNEPDAETETALSEDELVELMRTEFDAEEFVPDDDLKEAEG